jgi:hypothetical protein
MGTLPMAICPIRLTKALYRRAFCRVCVFPFNGFSTWRRSALQKLFDNSAGAAGAARSEAPQSFVGGRECERGASNHAARSKVQQLQELQSPAQTISTDGNPVSAVVLARAVIKPVENTVCECGGGRGRIFAERRTLAEGVEVPRHGGAAEAASLLSDGHRSTIVSPRGAPWSGRGRIFAERRTLRHGVRGRGGAGGRGRIFAERRTPFQGLSRDQLLARGRGRIFAERRTLPFVVVIFVLTFLRPRPHLC